MTQPAAARRVVVTGANGFLGRAALAPLIARGFEVHSLDRARPAGDDLDGAIAHVCDLMDPRAVRDVVARIEAQSLVHFAWSSDPRARWTSLDNLDWLDATLRLARAFADAGGRRFVGCGSCAEYDWSFSRLSETTPLAPGTLYGAAKAASYLALSRAAVELGLSFAWGRVFFCYGAREPAGRLMRDVIDNLLAGREAPCSDGLQVRDYLDARDIGAMFAALADSDADGAYNIARGEGVSVRELVTIAAELLDRGELVRFGALARRADDPETLVADMDKTRAALRLPAPTPHRAAIADIIAARRAKETPA
ncbi:MAG: NAD-dependent epimerase/dehydratase family protein [Alphaproteobacteria bacterium]|nr:NAD-dependent epimerase/dehydratase family protein [Alphaproteobacteria bacterium]